MSSLKGAFKSFKRNFAMSSASVLLVTLTLLVVGFVLVIGINTTKMSEDIVDSLNIYTYIPSDLSEEKLKELENNILEVDAVTKVKYSSADTELENVKTYFGENADLINEYFSGDNNPLEAVYVVSIDDSTATFATVATQIEGLEGVAKTDYGSDQGTDNLITMMDLVQYISLSVAIILFIVSLFIITNTIKLAITARRREIEIMRLVGATKTYIRMPFVVEGIFIGLVGGLLSTFILYSGYKVIFTSEYLQIIRSSMYAPKTIGFVLIVALPIMGMVIGIFGSLIALHRHLKT